MITDAEGLKAVQLCIILEVQPDFNRNTYTGN